MEKGGLKMRRSDLRAVVITAVLAMASILLIAGTVSAQGTPGRVENIKTVAKANGTDEIQLKFTVFNASNNTIIEWQIIEGSPSISAVNFYAKNATGQSITIGNPASLTYVTEINLTEHPNFYNSANNWFYLNITSTDAIPAFRVIFKDAGNSSNVTESAQLYFKATKLVFSQTSYTATAGVNLTLTIQARGDTGPTDTNYTGTVIVKIDTTTSSTAKLYNETTGTWDAQITATLVDGSVNVLFRDTLAETGVRVWANSTELTNASCTVDVNPGPLAKFYVTYSTTTRAGEPVDVTVKTMDAYDNLVTLEEDISLTFSSNGTADRVSWNPSNVVTFPAGYNTYTYSDLFNDTKAEDVVIWVNKTDEPEISGIGPVLTVNPNDQYYINMTVEQKYPNANAKAGECFNVTITIYDVFYNVNWTPTINPVIVTCDAPDQHCSVCATAPQPAGQPNSTSYTVSGSQIFYVNITRATYPSQNEQPWPYFNITANCTGLVPDTRGVAEATDNNVTIRNIEILPTDAYQIVVPVAPIDFQANGRAKEEYNITAHIMDVYGNNCTLTTNATGAQIYVTFNITENATKAYITTAPTEEPTDADRNTQVTVAVDNSTGIALAKAYLWSDVAIAQSYRITISLNNTQGLLNTTTSCNVTPWIVDHINIVFSKDPIVANGTDKAYITAYLVDADDVTVTTADFNVTFALNTTDPNAIATGYLSITVNVTAVDGVINGTAIDLWVNATKTNAPLGGTPIQKLNVTATAYAPYGLRYGWKYINVSPDEPAKVIIEASTTETEVTEDVTITVTVYDAYNNIVRDDTVVKFRTTSGLIDASKNTSGGQVTPAFTSPYLASTATITAAVMNYARTAVAATNSTSVTFLPSDADLTTEPPVNDYILEVNPATAPADGSTPVTITVYLKDHHGNTVTDTNATVYLSTTLGTLAATQGELVDGVFTTTLTSTVAGTATITANIGNWVLDADTVTFTEAPYEFDDTLHLKAGWNFISVPKRLNESCDEFGELFNFTEVVAIYSYDPEIGFFVPDPDDEVRVLDGYWVNVTAPVDIPLTYKKGYDVPPSKALKGGAWNAIGFSATTLYPASAALKSVETYWTTVIGWDAEAQTFESAIIKGFNDDEMMYPGKGYWLWVTQDCTLAALSA